MKNKRESSRAGEYGKDFYDMEEIFYDMEEIFTTERKNLKGGMQEGEGMQK